MIYYKLSNSAGSIETGKVYPQIQTMGCSFHKDAINSIYNIPSNRLSDFTPNLDCFILEPNALLTDFLSATQINYGFIISERVLKIITKYRLPEHKFYPAKIKHRNIFYNNYYWFLFIDSIEQNIDYIKTDFFMVDSFGDKENVQIKSAKDLQEVYEKTSSLKTIKSKKYFFSNKVELDLFHLHQADNNTYISATLAEALLENKITGIDLSKTEF